MENTFKLKRWLVLVIIFLPFLFTILLAVVNQYCRFFEDSVTVVRKGRSITLYMNCLWIYCFNSFMNGFITIDMRINKNRHKISNYIYLLISSMGLITSLFFPTKLIYTNIIFIVGLITLLYSVYISVLVYNLKVNKLEKNIIQNIKVLILILLFPLGIIFYQPELNQLYYEKDNRNKLTTAST